MASSFLAAPFVVQVHAVSALVALSAGAFQLSRRRRDSVHRRESWMWFGAMALTALSSFFIRSGAKEAGVGGFSLLHLLSILTLVSLVAAIVYAKRGAIGRHRLVMNLLFWLGLVVPALFTLLPGRLMHQVAFG